MSLDLVGLRLATLLALALFKVPMEQLVDTQVRLAAVMLLAGQVVRQAAELVRQACMVVQLP